MSWTGLSTALGLGFAYFLAAIPAGVAAGASVWMAGVAAWIGYSLGGAVVLLAGTPLREFLIKKMKISTERDTSKWIWRAWERWGLAGLGFLAPVTIGPQVTAILALAAGEKWLRTMLAISLGVLPWCIVFAVLTHYGVNLVK